MTRSEKPNRRAVLLAGLGAPAAAGVALTGGGEPAEAREVDDGGSPLLRETEHTRAYLASARF